jgi:hypothetical protein
MFVSAGVPRPASLACVACGMLGLRRNQVRAGSGVLKIQWSEVTECRLPRNVRTAFQASSYKHLVQLQEHPNGFIGAALIRAVLTDDHELAVLSLAWLHHGGLGRRKVPADELRRLGIHRAVSIAAPLAFAGSHDGGVLAAMSYFRALHRRRWCIPGYGPTAEDLQALQSVVAIQAVAGDTLFRGCYDTLPATLQVAGAMNFLVALIQDVAACDEALEPDDLIRWACATSFNMPLGFLALASRKAEMKFDQS